ncbi:MAG: hypothetical protein ACPGLY_27720, partial [Rubripirellula sp.]
MCTIGTFTDFDSTAPKQNRGSTSWLNPSIHKWTLLILVAAFSLLLSPSKLFANEAAHTRRLAREYNAKPEVVLWDKTRADLVGKEWVGEVDWAPKWAEGIGQCLYYGIVFERQ